MKLGAIETDLVRRHDVEGLVFGVNLTVEIVEDESGEAPVGVVLPKRFREDSGVRQVVPGDDRTGVQGRNSSAAFRRSPASGVGTLATCIGCG